MRANTHIYAEVAGRDRFADVVVDLLAGAGVRVVFGMPAESVNPVVDALRRDGRIQLVGVRHEGAAGIMAATYGRLTGRPGVCLGTAGPGATHLVLGACEAAAGRAPVLVLTGQVPVSQLGRTSFQEIDAAALFEPVTLASRALTDPSHLDVVARALGEAVVRGGPVHLAVCSDVFAAAAPRGTIRSLPTPPEPGVPVDKRNLEDAATLLTDAAVAVVVGDVDTDVAAEVTALAERVAAPVFVLPEGFRFLAGDPAPGGVVRVLSADEPSIAEAVASADAVLLVGPRSAAVDRIVGNRPVVQVAGGRDGADEFRPGWLRRPGCDSSGLDDLRQLTQLVPARAGQPWAGLPAGGGPDPELWQALDAALPADAVLAVEPGRVLDGAFAWLTKPGRTLTSSFGLAVPGCAVPAAIGAVFACPDRPVVAITTDAGLRDFVAELLTIRRYGLPVTVLCLDTGGPLDVAEIGAAAGLPGGRVTAAADLPGLLTGGPELHVLPVPPQPMSARPVAGQGGTLAEALAEALAAAGARHAYGRDLPASLRTALGRAGIDARPVHHPESAAMMASAVAKHTGAVAVAIASTAADLVLQLNGCYDAALDGVPLVVLGVRDRTWPVSGVQMYAEVATTAAVTGVDPAVGLIETAIRTRTVAYLEIDLDALDRPVPRGRVPLATGPLDVRPPDHVLDRAAALLATARRPAILVGGGGRGAAAEVTALAELLRAPVLTTLQGLGVLPDDHPHNAGGVGTSGHGSASRALAGCDVLLALGTSPRGAAFDLAGEFTLIQVDRDLARLTNPGGAGLVLHGTVAVTVEALTQRLAGTPATSEREQFLTACHRDHLAGRARHRPRRVPGRRTSRLSPATVAAELANSPLVTVDVGTVTLWVYRHTTGAGDIVWSGSFATMGFAVPAAIALSTMDDRRVVAAVGDGGLAITLSELASLAEANLPVTVVVFDNGRLGAIKYEQEIMGWPEYAAGLYNGDLARAARAFGVPAVRVTTRAELTTALATTRARPGPLLIDAVVDPLELPQPARFRPRLTHLVSYAVALAREARRGATGSSAEDGPLFRSVALSAAPAPARRRARRQS